MLNVTCLQGRITKEIELKVAPNGISCARFSIANETGYKDKKQTNFLNIVAWDKKAETAHKYCHKGDMVIIKGSIKTRSWDGTDGKKNYTTEIIADEVNFVGGKSENKSTYTTADQQNEEFTELEDDDSLPF